MTIVDAKNTNGARRATGATQRSQVRLEKAGCRQRIVMRPTLKGCDLRFRVTKSQWRSATLSHAIMPSGTVLLDSGRREAVQLL